MPDSLRTRPRRTRGSLAPRLIGIGAVAVIAAGALALAYARSARHAAPPHGPGARHPRAALSAKVARQQPVGLIDFGPYDDSDAWQDDPDDHPLMLVPGGRGMMFAGIPPSELNSGVPQWTADVMADGTDVFVYTPTGQCLTAIGSGLGLRRCAPVLGQRWRPVHPAIAWGQAFSAFASAANGHCLTAPRRPGPARLARCGPARTRSQEIAFWWSP